jgi:diguanylate cyclase (GGDEF)-like protein
MAELARTQAVDEVQHKIQALSTRDLQLWSIGLLVLLVLALGFLALVLPNVVWGARTLSVAGTYLPQLFFGFIALIVLFNIYVVGQRRELNAARQELVTELMFTQRAHNLSLVDPLTQIFNRRYLDHIVPKEISRADRNAAPLTFVLFDLEGFRDINARQGHKAGDELLVEAARALQQTFAASETVLRYGGDEFLVIMPDCNEQQAADTVERVLATAKLWNETSHRAYKMAFRCGMASYRPGSDIKEVLRSAEARVESVREKSREDTARTRPQCLLLCADEAAVQMLQPMLESLEVRTERCAGAAEGLHKLACQRFEAVLADCSTDEGMQFAASASALPSRRHMILIALASSSADVALLGANFVLEKPLSAALAASSLRVAQTIMMAERQRYYRHSISLPVTISFGRGQAHCATATDLSEGGMAVLAETVLPAGQSGLLRFVLDNQPIDVRAEVAWTDGQGHSGLQFKEMSPVTRGKFEKWLAEQFRERHSADSRGRMSRGATA